MGLLEFYGIDVPRQSILDRIATCRDGRQLQFMTRWIVQNIQHVQRRTYNHWLAALRAKQKELGVTVLIEEQGGSGYGG